MYILKSIYSKINTVEWIEYFWKQAYLNSNIHEFNLSNYISRKNMEFFNTVIPWNGMNIIKWNISQFQHLLIKIPDGKLHYEMLCHDMNMTSITPVKLLKWETERFGYENWDNQIYMYGKIFKPIYMK